MPAQAGFRQAGSGFEVSMNESAQSLKRLLYLVLGWLFFGLGVLGVFLPVLPTTPFMLLALGAFARSSERLRAWLYHHPRYGPPLQQWHRYRVIPLRAKLLALFCMALSLAYLAFLSPAPAAAVMASAALMALGAGYILTKPSHVADALPLERTERLGGSGGSPAGGSAKGPES